MAEGRPELSVVIPSVNGWSDLAGCLSALYAQEGDVTLEILVVDRVGAEVRDQLAEAAGQVRLLEVADGTAIPAMRAIGFEAARAPVIGVIEDHVIVPVDWAQRMLIAQGNGERVVAGSVENAACDRLVEWAAFLCEYSQCLDPVAGAAEWLPGNNTTYDASLLAEYQDVIAEGGWENRLHDALRDAGIPLISRPEIRVGHKKHFTFWEYFTQRYLYSRSYAGVRSADAGFASRLAYAAGALALPPVLALRVAGGVWRSGKHRGHLLRSIPLIGLFVMSWAAGEFVGALFGPGDALSRVT